MPDHKPTEERIPKDEGLDVSVHEMQARSEGAQGRKLPADLGGRAGWARIVGTHTEPRWNHRASHWVTPEHRLLWSPFIGGTWDRRSRAAQK